MSGKNLSSLDVFIEGVPAGLSFNMNLDKLLQIVNKLDIGADICYIGLIAFFEAFCKSHFASLVNICPHLIHQFKQKGHDVDIDATDLLSLGNLSEHQIGFLIAEKYDFGTPQKINSYYNSLVLITPFSKDEKTKYEKMLQERNLLVHHGGVYTMSYVKQIQDPLIRDQVFLNPIYISKDQFMLSVSFITSIAKKMMKSSQKAIRKHIQDQGISISEEMDRAINFLTLWDVGEDGYV